MCQAKSLSANKKIEWTIVLFGLNICYLKDNCFMKKIKIGVG